jgi:hypothetical protein
MVLFSFQLRRHERKPTVWGPPVEIFLKHKGQFDFYLDSVFVLLLCTIPTGQSFDAQEIKSTSVVKHHTR